MTLADRDVEVFDLRDVVRAELRRNPSPDPYVVAAAVVDRLDLDEVRVALAAVLPLYVRSLAARGDAVAPLWVLTGEGHSVVDAHGMPARPGRIHVDATAEARRAGANRRRAWLARRAPGADGAYKFLGDFEQADCAAAAAERRKHAEDNAARAAWFERVEVLLGEHAVGTVKELPESLLDGLS